MGASEDHRSDLRELSPDLERAIREQAEPIVEAIRKMREEMERLAVAEAMSESSILTIDDVAIGDALYTEYRKAQVTGMATPYGESNYYRVDRIEKDCIWVSISGKQGSIRVPLQDLQHFMKSEQWQKVKKAKETVRELLRNLLDQTFID